MKTFVEYYKIFEDLTIERKEILSLLEKENFTKNSCDTKASVGRTIFKKNMEKLALKLISNSDKVDSDIKEKAKKLLLTRG